MSRRLKIRLLGLITFVNAVIGITLGGLLYTIWPDHYFTWYPTIPLFYWLTALAMLFFLDQVRHQKGDVTITTYMLVRLCKFTLALIFLCLYAALVREHLRSFGFTLMLFYFIYLSMETYMLYLYEKKRMKREREEKEKQHEEKRL